MSISTKEKADSQTDFKEWSEAINLTISPSVKFVDISFYSLDNLISELGGTYVIMQSIFIIALTLFLDRRWLKSLVKEVSPNTNNKREEEVLNEIKDRVSYKGIYELHNKVNYLEWKNNKLTVENLEMREKIEKIENKME